MRVRDNLPKSWLVTSPSSDPLHLAKAAASCFTWLIAPEWRPPKVSIAKGKKINPSRLQASAVSLTFLWQAFAREAPATAAAPATFEGEMGGSKLSPSLSPSCETSLPTPGSFWLLTPARPKGPC